MPETKDQTLALLSLVDEHETVSSTTLLDGTILAQAPGLSALVMLDGTISHDQPMFALVSAASGHYVVQPFEYKRHINPRYGWTYPGVKLFRDMGEVAHLRDRILN